MLTPMVCFTCGFSLGDIAPVYHFIRQNRMATHLHGKNASAPTRVAVDPSLTKNIMGDVLDALGVEDCCRTRLVTAMIFSDHY